jgi:hypothetical protein
LTTRFKTTKILPMFLGGKVTQEGSRTAMRTLAILFALGGFREFYVALGERDPWLSLAIAAVLIVICRAVASRWRARPPRPKPQFVIEEDGQNRYLLALGWWYAHLKFMVRAAFAD